MIRAALFSFALLFAATASAQDVKVRVGGMGMGIQVQEHGAASAVVVGAPIPAESYRLDFENNPDGATLMKVVSPEGARVQVFNGKVLAHEDDIPTSFAASPDTFYRFLIKLPDGRVWEKKLSAKRRSTGTLALVVSAPVQQVVVVDREREEHRHHDHDRDHDRRDDRVAPGPMPMSEADFASLKAAIEGEGFEEQKVSVLSTAAGSTYFTVNQVGELVDLFAFSGGKVKVVEIAKPRILDPQNSFQLYSHFAFDSDKQKVKRILGQ